MVLSFYDVLGVAPDATLEQIKAAFHSAALQNHPDKAGSASQSSHEGFMQAQRAWEVGLVPSRLVVPPLILNSEL
jgi:diphthamide biosynthesis protein 4